MKATFSTRKNKYTSSHRKEKGGFFKEYAALVPSDRDEMRAVVTLRLYWPGQVTCYACLWVTQATEGGLPGLCFNGSGSAAGNGYDKPSAAAGEAIRNAGFDLSEDIGGRGESSIKEAVKAMAEALGWPGAKLHVAHA